MWESLPKRQKQIKINELNNNNMTLMKEFRRLFHVHSDIRIMYHELTVIFTFQRTYKMYIVSTFLATVTDADLSLFRPPFCFPVAADT